MKPMTTYPVTLQDFLDLLNDLNIERVKAENAILRSERDYLKSVNKQSAFAHNSPTLLA